jgi:FOG: FHA domain
VIDNLRVSRVHAQIRQMNNKHILFDLDSTAGTKVNGIKIRQHTLNHGDVIEIADVPLIYGSDQEPPAVIEKSNKTRVLSGKNPKEQA